MLGATLEGLPFARGHQHGQHFAAEIRETIRTYCPERWLSDPEVQTLKRRLLESLAAEAPELVVEMVGISEGAKVPWEQITLLNLVLASNSLECASVSDTFKLACSAIGFADSDVGPLAAKNCDETLRAAPFYLFQTVRPVRGMAYLCISWVGTVWAEAGLNEAGLAVVQTAGPSVPDQDGYGVVCNIAPRLALERCRTTHEATALLERTDVSGWGMGAVIADEDGTVVALEKTYDRQAVRAARRAVAYCTNHFEEPIMEGTVAFAHEGIIPNSQTRYRTLGRLFGERGWPRTLEGMMGALGYHDAEGFVCQHGQSGLHSNYSFIAAPRMRQVWLGDGYPCERRYTLFQI